VARVSFKIVATGKVQGVSFRVIMKETALHHRVDGWVRNRGDGSVEAIVQGEEEGVKKVIEWARAGPPLANVVTLTAVKIPSYPRQTGFRIVT
jgi:acylphosphatase